MVTRGVSHINYHSIINVPGNRPYINYDLGVLKLDTGIHKTAVVANRENETCFENGLVMGFADCVNLAGLVITLERLFKRKLGPLPDSLQAGACIFPPFWKAHDHVV